MATPASRPALGGTFLQLLPYHREWPETRWHELFGYYRTLGLREVVVQWSSFGDIALFPAPLETILKAARHAGIAVDLGLHNDPEYWQRIQGNRAAVAAYLQTVAARSETIASRLAHYRFRGWYICEEIDDFNWRSADARVILLNFLGGLSRTLEKIRPRRPISISGFAQGQPGPEALGELWRDIFRHTRIRTLLLQDGVGTGKVTLSGVAAYYAAAHNAARHEGRSMRPVVEIFRQVQADPFRGAPAPLDRIGQQVHEAQRYGRPLAFSVMEYMTPLGVPGAQELYLASIGSR